MSSVTFRDSHSGVAAEGSNLQGCDSVLLDEGGPDVVSTSSRARVTKLIDH